MKIEKPDRLGWTFTPLAMILVSIKTWDSVVWLSVPLLALGIAALIDNWIE